MNYGIKYLQLIGVINDVINKKKLWSNDEFSDKMIRSYWRINLKETMNKYKKDWIVGLLWLYYES